MNSNEFLELDILNYVEQNKTLEIAYEEFNNIQLVEVPKTDYPVQIAGEVMVGYEAFEFVKEIGKKFLKLLKKLIDMVVNGIKTVFNYIKKLIRKMLGNKDEITKDIIEDLKKDINNINNYKIEKLTEGPVAINKELNAQLKQIFPILVFNYERLVSFTLTGNFVLDMTKLLNTVNQLEVMSKYLLKVDISEIEKTVKDLSKLKKSGNPLNYGVIAKYDDVFTNTNNLVKSPSISSTLQGLEDNFVIGNFKNNIENFIKNYPFASNIIPLLVYNFTTVNNDVVVRVKVLNNQTEALSEISEVVYALATKTVRMDLRIDNVKNLIKMLSKIDLDKVEFYAFEPNIDTANFLLAWDNYLNKVDDIADSLETFAGKVKSTLDKAISIAEKDLKDKDGTNDYYNYFIAGAKLDIEPFIEQLKEFSRMVYFGDVRVFKVMSTYINESLALWEKK